MSEVPVSCETDRPLQLVRSMNGGTVLIYKCQECGAELSRTRDQAEVDAIKTRVTERVVQDEHILRRLSE